jgi:hypothetical protein
MRAIGYMIAGAALLPGLVNSLDPAPDTSLPIGWKYKGCFTYDVHSMLGNKSLNSISDIWWDGDNSKEASPAPYGVLTQPRTLNGYFNRLGTNGAVQCINECLAQNRGFTFAGTAINNCCNIPSLKPVDRSPANSHVKFAIPSSRGTVPLPTVLSPMAGVSKIQIIANVRAHAGTMRVRLVDRTMRHTFVCRCTKFR